MPLFSSISLVFMMLYLFMGISIYLKNPAAALNRLFLILTLFFTSWSLCSYLLFMPGITQGQALLVHRIFGFAWSGFAAIWLHFALTLTGKHHILKNPLFMPLIYTMAAFFWFWDSLVVLTDFVPDQGFWKPIYNDRLLGILPFSVYYAMLIISGLAMVGHWMTVIRNNQKKQQARIILIGGMTAFVIGAVTDTVMPVFFGRFVIPTASFCAIIWIASIAYSVARYRFLTLTPAVAAQDILQTMQEAVMLVSPDGFISWANRMARTILGYRKFDLNGTPLNRICTGNAQSACQLDIRHPQNITRMEGGFLNREGQVVPVEMSRSVIMDDDGERAGYVFVFQDISERKKREVLLHKFESAISRSFNAIAIFSPDGTLEFANLPWANLFGYNHPLELSSQPLRLFLGKPWPPHESSDAGLPLILNSEETLKKKNGEHFFAWISIAPYNDSEGRHAGWVVVATDVTRRKQFDEVLLQESRMAAASEALFHIAHHWRNPLNRIGILLQNLDDQAARGTLNPEDLTRKTAIAMDTLEDLSRSISDFSTFFASGKENRDYPLGLTMKKAVELLRHSLEDQRFTLELEQDGEWILTGREGDLSRCLFAIIHNTMDAANDRQPASPWIRIGLYKSTFGAEIKIRDNCGGLTADCLPRIFDPFFSTRDMKSGMGLTITRTIIEKQMNGTISARNLEDGLEIRLHFPQARPNR